MNHDKITEPLLAPEQVRMATVKGKKSELVS